MDATTLADVQISFPHNPALGTFLYVRTVTPSLGYALGHEYTRPPYAKGRVVLYSSNQTSPFLVGRICRMVTHYEDCVEVEIQPVPSYAKFHPTPFLLRIPDHWYELTPVQSFYRRLYLRFRKPPASIVDYTDIYPVLFSTLRLPQGVEPPPGPPLLHPIFQYSPKSSPYYEVRVLD